MAWFGLDTLFLGTDLNAFAARSKTMDLLICVTNASQHPNMIVYTNGVSCGTASATMGANHKIAVLGTGALTGGSMPPTVYQNCQGWLADFIVWTNMVSSTTVSNFHYYATNLYGTNVIGPTGIYP